MESKNTEDRFPIVGIGASAGGLEALEQFFRHAPIDSGMAFVLVQHLDPNHASLLTEIMQRTTSMPVVEAQDQVQVARNCVYVIPPNRDMAIFHGKLQLSVPNEPRGQRMPIDAFLRSLAEDQEEKAVGIILSGTGTDGTLGLRAILGAGGLSLVQEPATAKYDGMPTSAIHAGYASLVLPVVKMPDALLKGAGIMTVRPEMPKVVKGINRILMQLRTITGHDFALYKKSTIGRRIERRMSQNNIDDADVYALYLKENPAEVHLLFKELLINVTNFFRDIEAFAVLENEILPQLCADKPDNYLFRVWVAGCATGEEAYSIAILLRERMAQSHQEFKVQIYSTDLDDDAIATARAGFYPPNIAQDVTPERLRRFFIKEEAGYRVKKEIREMIVFATQNVIKDPPFTKLDLLSCRNLMIYLEAEMQNRLIPMFHYALKPGGVLFLSPSESVGNHTELFSSLNRKWKLYRATHSIKSSRALMAHVVSWASESGDTDSEETMKKITEPNFAELTRRLLVQCFAPASVVIDHKGNILYVHGDTGKYLRPAPGQASLNVVDMAREGMELELRTAIRAAANEGASILGHELQVKTNGGFSTVSLSVRPLPDGSHNLLLVSFQDVVIPGVKSKGKRIVKTAELGRIEELERNIAYLKESHQLQNEEQQATNEELKSTNEEMQSTNEELQSTNEELETSKEELQSVNEELITVNSELQAKIEQLAGMQNDMKNLLDNTNIGTVFLDDHMKIRRFTREATRIYRLVPSDVGRLLSDIKSDLDSELLMGKAQAVLESLAPVELEMRADSGVWYLVRIQPYRTLDNVIEGVVLTFTDISKRIEAETRVQLAGELAENIVNTIREPLLVLDSELQVVSANRAFYQYFQVITTETIGRKIYELGNSQWNIPALRELLEIILPRDQSVEGYVVEHDFPAIGHHKIKLNARRLVGKSIESSLILLTTEDISDELTKENKI
ncbi:chemotaxis protein CheB [Methylicorpusculum sp.]|uniref:chemotaxis protein CheB n=1 Tax=Methylicorpusculum sp. TaxID=2713644 RepID=UPI00272F2D63|nr:chemotaxis protein CheB [Methylicorpusculum sp.]MDP2180538.1 chemotaxis protein CheB [Methylicorpusculum sp.]MDP3529692.1 chemotaxis protein CheB [Methylicorpusculum sp.]MDZ4150247.1 chemotaxis protein CheB [Methylicorpusculum sp.]